MKTYTNEPYQFAQIKADGFSLKIKRDQFGQVKALTRGYDEISEKLRHVATAQGLWKCDKYTELHGELWVPGRQSSDVLRALNSRDQALRFDVFHILNITSCTDAELWCVRNGLKYLPFIVEGTDPEHDTVTLEKLHPWAKRLEGVVLKGGACGDGLKYKRERTIDLIVTGFKWGTGKYTDMVGALLCCTSDGVERASVSGFDDETRAALSLRVPAGAIIEVRYQNVGANGRLRHPRFVRWRDDKTSAECGPEQDGDLCAPQ